jgi:GT2 family glycosyltransferase
VTGLPTLSIVIPTRNRLPCLRQCLAALASQNGPDTFEVIVVADGCTDGTEDQLRHGVYPFALRVCAQTARGAAAARNLGAQNAAAPVLLFLDDDVIASPGLVDAHVRAHADHAERVAVGPYRLASPAAGDFFGRILFDFWERTFAAMEADPCPQDAQYVLSGNLSIPASVFHRVGGFNDTFPAAGVEDYEFGLRLLAARVPLVFAAAARAKHLDTTDMAASLRRARHEGKMHVHLAIRHPAARPALGLSRVGWVSRALVFEAQGLGRLLAAVGPPAVDAARRLGLRRVHAVAYGGLRHYWYCRGVADGAGTRARLAEMKRRGAHLPAAREPRA